MRVREQNVKLVQAAVEKLGYVRDVSAANLVKRREYRFVFVVPDNKSQFVSTIRDGLADVSKAPGPDCISVATILHQGMIQMQPRASYLV